MRRTPRPWTVLPHVPVRKLEENLRIVESGLPNGNLKRTMMVARYSDGQLMLFNAVPLEEPAMVDIEAWGTPAYLYVPNGFHRLDIHAFKRRYPALKLVTPGPCARRVGEIAAVDMGNDDVPKDKDVELVTLRGTKIAEATMLVRSNGCVSLCFGDALMNLVSIPGFDGFLMKLIGSTGGPKVTLLAKLAVVGNKKELAAHFEELARVPGLARLIPSHGELVEAAAAAVLQRVARKI